MENIENIYNKALKLRPAERLQLMEMIARSLDQPNEKIDEIWANEAESRYEALIKGDVRTIALDDIIARYK
jgi:putative addiction module component (TIGR02574 family)